MDKTCETCKWWVAEREACSHNAPDFSSIEPVYYPTRGPNNFCSKWETKLERECGNCDYFTGKHGEYECRRREPSEEGKWPMTWRSAWCGEFRGQA